MQARVKYLHHLTIIISTLIHRPLFCNFVYRPVFIFHINSYSANVENMVSF